jgi:tRNA G26 N,N-dimethylase Trm1
VIIELYRVCCPQCGVRVETGEPLWFGQDRKQETLDEFFRTQLNFIDGFVGVL